MEAEGPIEPITIEAANSAAESPIEQAPGRATRVRTKPERYRFLINDDQNITLIENDEPQNYEEVLKSSEQDLRN